MVTKCWIML